MFHMIKDQDQDQIVICSCAHPYAAPQALPSPARRLRRVGFASSCHAVPLSFNLLLILNSYNPLLTFKFQLGIPRIFFQPVSSRMDRAERSRFFCEILASKYILPLPTALCLFSIRASSPPLASAHPSSQTRHSFRHPVHLPSPPKFCRPAPVFPLYSPSALPSSPVHFVLTHPPRIVT